MFLDLRRLRHLRLRKSVDTVKLMEPLTVYNEEVTGPEHAMRHHVAQSGRRIAPPFEFGRRAPGRGRA